MPPQQKQSKLPLIIVSLLLVLSLVFGLWAYGQTQSYKTTAAKNTAAAAAADKKATAVQAKYDELAKAPYKTFQGSATYGSVSFNYPKNWSGYDGSGTDEPINAYFYPDIVPKTDGDTAYPLRVELLSTDYAEAVQQLSGQVTDGSVKAAAYIPPKMKGVTNVQPGTRFDGAIAQNGSGTQQGTLIIIKVRDKTLQVSAQSAAAVKDLDNIVLASLTFVP